MTDKLAELFDDSDQPSKSGTRGTAPKGATTGALKAGGGGGRTVRTGDAPVRGFPG
jgi:hypothetical protein